MKIKVKEIQSLNEKIIMKGFSKSAFSKEIELSQPMTVQITNGERSPSPRAAKRICEVLECEWSDLFEIVKTPQGVNK